MHCKIFGELNDNFMIDVGIREINKLCMKLRRCQVFHIDLMVKILIGSDIRNAIVIEIRYALIERVYNTRKKSYTCDGYG